MVFHTELEAAAAWVYDKLGLFGLSLFVFFNDVVVSPLPPELAFVVVSRTGLREHAWLVVTFFGVLSSLAGWAGWALSRALSETGIAKRIFGSKLERAEKLVMDFGQAAVVLGALTPIPYSLTVWAAGLFRMPFRKFWWTTLFRVPRFILYYWVVSSAGKIGL
jgi:membrane protein YqaA with SNARE-associated domain